MAAADVLPPNQLIQPLSNQNQPNSQQPDFRYRHLSDVTSALGGLWRRRLYTDLTLVADGKCVRCHKVVLASASPYFHSRLFNGKRESSTDRLFIQDVAQDVLTDVLDFVYSGECRLTADNAEDVLRAAVIFGLVALKDMCDFFIKDHIDARNAIRLFKVARATQSRHMEEKARETIVKNFAQLWRTRLFRQLTHRELISVISRDDLNTPSEDMVCGAVLAWVHADKQRRTCVLGQILRHVRLTKVGKETLRQLVEEEDAVKGDTVCTEMIHEALAIVDPPPPPEDLPPVVTPRQEVKPPPKPKPDDVLVMLGGVEADGSRFRSRQRVHAFNLPLRKWLPLAPLPLGCDSGAACCAKDNDLLVSGAGETRQSLVRYDCHTNTWKVLAPMLVGRRGHCLVALGNYVYVLGGINTGNDGAAKGIPGSPRPQISPVIERYDICNNSWKVVGALAEPVWGASAVVIRDKIHVMGGFQVRDKPTSIVQTFDPGSKTSALSSQLPIPVALSRAVVHEDRVYVLGPSGNIIATRDGWRFDVVASIPDFRRALFGVAAYEGALYVVGGRFGDKVHDDMLLVDVRHGTMVHLPQRLPLPMWGFGFFQVALDRSFMVKAGTEETDY